MSEQNAIPGAITLIGTISKPKEVAVQSNKNAFPLWRAQEVEPDAGYDAMAKVTITADLASQASQADSASTPVVLDFSNTGIIHMGGWGQYFRSKQEDTNTQAGSNAWGNPRKCKIKLPKACTEIGMRAFSGMSGLVEIDASEVAGMLTVKSRAFFATPNLTTAGTAFWNKLKSVTTNSFRPATGNTASAFEAGNDITAPNLDTVELFDGYDSYPFSRCGWTSFTAPKLPKISEGMFSNCTNMTTADFTAVASIESGSFAFCSALTDLYLRGDSVVSLNSDNAFTGVTISGLTLHVPSDLVESYKVANNWATLYSNGMSIEAISE